jgi:WD40 repeat protein
MWTKKTAVLLLALGVLAGATALVGEPASAGTAKSPANPPLVIDPKSDPLPPGAIGRMGTQRFRHGSRILALAFSVDGQTLAAGGGDDALRLWDVTTGKERGRINEPWVNALVFSPRGKVLITGNGFKKIRVWDWRTGEELRMFKGHKGAIKALALDDEGRVLVSAGQDKTIRMWVVPIGKPIPFDQDQYELTHHTDEVNALAFHPDGTMFASGSSDRTIRLWRSPQGQLVRTIKAPCAVTSLAFAPDGQTLVSGGDDGRVRLWEVESGKQLRVLAGKQTSVNTVAFSPDGKMILSSGDDETIRRWDATTFKPLSTIVRPSGDGAALAISPQGLLASAGLNNTIRLWDLATAKEVGLTPGHHSGIASITLSPDGKSLVSGSANGKIQQWDALAGKPLREYGEGLHGEVLLSYSPDGKTLAAAAEHTVRLFDAASGKERGQLSGLPGDPIACLAFSPDSKTLAVGYRNDLVRLWDLATTKEVRQFKYPGGPLALAFAPDNKRLVGAGAGKIVLWEVGTGNVLHEFGGAGTVASLSFSPDGKLVAAGMYDGAIRLWDPIAGKELRSCEGHSSVVYALAFAPDGRTLASGSYDRTVRLWEVASALEVRAWPGHVGGVSAVAFFPDGRLVASGSADTTLMVWDATGRLESGQLPSVALAEDELDTLWADLASVGTAKSYPALWSAVCGAQQSVPFFKKRVFVLSPEKVAKLITDLNNDKYKVRKDAMTELTRLGRWIEDPLRRALEKQPVLEMRKRIELILGEINKEGGLSLQQERLRLERVMGALEQIATPAAKQVLESLAAGAAAEDLREQAEASLQRLARKGK